MCVKQRFWPPLKPKIAIFNIFFAMVYFMNDPSVYISYRFDFNDNLLVG